MSRLATLQLTEAYSKRLSEAEPLTQRSRSAILTERQKRRDSVLLTEKHYRAIEKDSEQQENIRENRLNCLFLRRKENLKLMTRANQDIFLRIQSQKSQYALKKLRSEFLKNHKISAMISKHNGGASTARPKSSVPRTPLASITPLCNLEQLDRHLRSREDEIRQALQER